MSMSMSARGQRTADAAGRQQADLLFNKIEKMAISFARADLGDAIRKTRRP